MQYKYLTNRGALNEAVAAQVTGILAGYRGPPALVERIPGSVARENLIFPIGEDGDTVPCLAVNGADVMLADKLRFILNRNIRLVSAGRDTIIALINRHYGRGEAESVNSMLSVDTDADLDEHELSLDDAAMTRRQRGGGFH